jgi:acyl-CoA thioester hydrolase
MVHSITLRVRFNELDPYNHVNHAVYISYFETARVEALAAIGLPINELAEKGFQFVITEVHARYRQPALAGDVVTVETWLSKTGRVSSIWSQRIMREDTVLVEGEVRAGITNVEGRAARPPAWLNEQLLQLAEPPADG